MKRLMIASTTALFALSGVAIAQDSQFGMQIEARKGIMVYRQLQLMTLGEMAKGNVSYDAAAAQKAADNLLASVTIDTSMLWPEGSDNVSVPESKALPALWTDPAVGASGMATFEAATAMQAAAGTDLASLQAAMGPVGEACTACHKIARASD